MALIELKSTVVPVVRQCTLFGLPRSSVYYRPKTSGLNLALMHRLDELFTAYPFLGYRKLTVMLRREGHNVNHKRVRRLLRKMGLMAVYQAPDTSRKHPGHRVYPYLLKKLPITRPGQVWSTDITYIRMKGGFIYLVAIIDWYSRAVLAWRVSASMDTGFCLEALEEAFANHPPPEIFNSDQGSQFTSLAFTERLTVEGIRISMDGRGSYHDNIFTERLWRSVKYEEVYLREYQSLEYASQSLGAYFVFYNHHRPHQALGYKTPAQVHQTLAQPAPMDMMDNSCGVTHIPTGQHQLPCGAFN